MPDLFNQLQPYIENNPRLRIPQRDAFARIEEHFEDPSAESEIGVVLPVGCGKSGLISIAPFACGSHRVLVVAPYVKIAEQLYETFDPTSGDKFFYAKCNVLDGSAFPEPVEIRGTTTNRDDLDESDVVITNIDQLQGADNRWLTDLPEDYFDLILFDEGHHAVADSWEILKQAFPHARIINFSATPRRADGQLMPGRIRYSYPVRDAIAEGYVKRLKALVLNPATLRYVRPEGNEEIEVSLDEVRRLGEEDVSFRRSIVSSQETLTTIIDASIHELRRIRTETGDSRHKIIASALNFDHCHQIVEGYRARRLRADFIHSRLQSTANDRVLDRLENHQLDVIVQVRKLGEGFDHPYLSVAAVCSIFRELSPFVQFVGRIMRVIDQENKCSPLNQGTVVFHAGANIAQRWDDFREFSEADQEFFDQLLPMESLDFSNAREIEIRPQIPNTAHGDVRGQTGVTVQEIPLLHNEEAMRAIRTLQESGYSVEDIREAFEHQPLPTTLVRRRQAARSRLDNRVRLTAGTILNERSMNPEGHELDTQHLGKSNFVTVKSRIDQLIRERVADKPRSEYTQGDLDQATAALPAIRAQVEEEFFDAQT